MLQSKRRTLMGLAFGALLGALRATPAESQNVVIERLSDRVVVASVPVVGRASVTTVATKKGLVVIDTGNTPSITTREKAEIEKQLGRTDWVFMINTHAHDHVGGNSVFKQIPIIAHENIAGEMKTSWVDAMASAEKRAPSVRFVQGKIEEVQKQLDGGGDAEALKAQLALWRVLEGEATNGFEVVIPAVRFSEDLTLDMGDATIRAMYFGKGHSTADVVVYVPEEKLLVAGGTCNPFLPPVADTAQLGDLKRAVAVLDRVLESGVDHVVTGHLEISDGALVQHWRDYYRDLLNGVSEAHAQGLTIEQAQARLGLEQRFPYMKDAKARRGTKEEAHAANVAAVWKLVAQP